MRSSNTAEPLYTTSVDSPVGQLRLVASDRGLIAVLWSDEDGCRVPLAAAEPAPRHAILVAAGQQIAEYFDGTRTAFTLTLDPRGTAFQQAVWQALCTIPFGETTTYGDLAKALGHVAGARAVGAANGRNPLSIVVPCHRVVGTGGRLTGFAGGLANKAFLLDHERRHEAGRGQQHLPL